ncbi:MAG: SWF/SNF helicase family protein, partial [Veillonella sp.]|nr:SWF/SNF helicase family protein [Veillonella sp.]
YEGASAKVDLCLEIVRNAIDSGHRILIFSQFTSMLDILEDHLRESTIDFYRIDGSTDKQERLRLVNAFNEGVVPVFLTSLKAGGYGLNLTGADMVIHYDPWWNQAVENQATDRAYRMGQTKNVLVYTLIMKDTIEEKIAELQASKSALADSILSGEGVSMSVLTQDDIAHLLEI